MTEFEDTFPDIGSMNDEELKALISERERGDATISGGDVQQLTEVLLGKVPAVPEEETS
jgi:hypothetical protein